MSDDFAKRVASLSDDKRELLELFLRERRIDTDWLQETYVAPRTPVEETLVGIWQDVLGVERVGIHDNFFELGGDSILSIQIIARANHAGLVLRSSHDLFEKPTIGELAPLLERQDRAPEETVPIEGEPFLTPGQARALGEGTGAPALRGRTVEIAIPRGTAVARLDPLPSELERRHDALRLRFRPSGATWRVGAAPDAATSGPLHRLAADRPRTGPHEEIGQDVEAELWNGLDPVEGPLFRLGLLEPTAEHGGRLLLAVHPLVADHLSLWLLRDEIAAAVARAAEGAEPTLPPEGTSFQRWTQALAAYARSDEVVRGLDRWRAALVAGTVPPPGEAEAGEASVERILGREETRVLLEEVPLSHRAQVEDVLLAALSGALAERSGSRRVVVNVETHGRQPVAPGVDASRTVGCFTALYPVALDLPEAAGPVEVLRAVKEQRRELAEEALSYDALRHLGPPEAARALAELPEPEVLVSYRGRTRARPESSAEPAAGPSRTLPRRGRHRLHLLCRVVGPRIHLSCAHAASDAAHAEAADLADRTLERLRELLDHCRRGEGTAVTPSDFSDADLSQEELDTLLSREP